MKRQICGQVSAVEILNFYPVPMPGFFADIKSQKVLQVQGCQIFVQKKRITVDPPVNDFSKGAGLFFIRGQGFSNHARDIFLIQGADRYAVNWGVSSFNRFDALIQSMGRGDVILPVCSDDPQLPIG